MQKLTNSLSRSRILSVLFASVLLAAPAFSSPLVSYTGQVQLLPLPDSLVVNTYQSDAAVSMFLEKSATALQTPLSVDVAGPGFYNTLAGLTPATLSAGTTVYSTLLHSDPVTSTGLWFSGSVTFSSDILGVILQSATLDQSDATVGAAGVTYSQNLAARGLELTGAMDSVTISPDSRTLSFTFRTGAAEDEVRVLTAGAVNAQTFAQSSAPEPGTISLLGLGLGAAVLARKFSKGAARS